MNRFLDIVFSFPTAVFTAFVALSMVFWVLVIAGGLGLEFFDVDLEIDAAAEHADHTVTELLGVLGVGTVPFSIMLTVFALWGWTLTFLASLSLTQVTDLSVVAEFGVLLAATAAALPLTGLVTNPLKRLFATGGDRGGTSIVGSVCEITTSRVDDEFGRASVFEDGADLVLSVRCERDNDLERGDEALIIDYEDARDVYRVEPYDDVLDGSNSDLATLEADLEGEDDGRDEGEGDAGGEEDVGEEAEAARDVRAETSAG